MNLFSDIFGWFKHHFPGHGNVVQTILADSSELINFALPYIKELNELVPDTHTTEPATALSKIEGFVTKIEPDAEKAKIVVDSLSGFSTKDILQKAAEWALGFLQPGQSTNSIRFAIEFALKMVLASPIAAGL